MKFLYIDYVADRTEGKRIFRTIAIDIERMEWSVWNEGGVMWDNPQKFENFIDHPDLHPDKAGFSISTDGFLSHRDVDRDEQAKWIAEKKVG